MTIHLQLARSFADAIFIRFVRRLTTEPPGSWTRGPMFTLPRTTKRVPASWVSEVMPGRPLAARPVKPRLRCQAAKAALVLEP